MPDNVVSGTQEVKREWLSEKTAEVVDKFIMFSDEPVVSEVPERQKKLYPCRAQGCQHTYSYQKSRDKHELKKHNMVVSDTLQDTPASQNDHKQAHSMARLSFSFFLMDMLDAVKEGDGGRLMRLYKVALLYYKAHGHSHYAYSTFLLTVQLNAVLSPRMAHSLTWNRFWNTRGGKGVNIPLDLHLEHLNNFLKSFLKGQGPNLSELSASRISQSLGVFKNMMEKVDEELSIKRPTGTHRANQEAVDVLTLVSVFTEGRVFSDIPGRFFHAFPGFHKNPLVKLNDQDIWKWMKDKLDEWSCLKL